MSWRARFEALVRDLEQHLDLVVEAATLGAPASKGAIDAAEAALTRRLPASLRAFYRELDGVTIRWHHRSPKWRAYGASGAIAITPVGRLADVASALPWIPIDWPDGGESFVGLTRTRSSSMFGWIEDADPVNIRPLTNDFADYLEALLETRGWRLWPSMFLYDPSHAWRADHVEGRLQAVLPLLFRTFDVTRVGRAAKCRPMDVRALLEADRVIVYRLRDLPRALTRDLALEGSAAEDALFFLAPAASPILRELSEALPRGAGDAGAATEAAGRLAARIATLSKKVEGTRALLAPYELSPGVAMSSLRVAGSFHAGHPAEVEAFLRARAELFPVALLLEEVALFELRSASGDALDEVIERSHVVNPFQRSDFKAIAPGLFVVDRRDERWKHFRLHHAPNGLRFAGTRAGPGEQWLDVSIEDLPTGAVTPLTLTS